MKLIIIVMALALSVSCSNNAGSSNGSEKIEQTKSYLITPAQFKTKIKDENIVVLDVRTPEEVAEGVIGNPLVINYRSEDFKKQLLGLDKSKTYLVYCKAGGRSGKTKAFMDDNGFESVYDLDGGITAWKSANLSVD